MKILYSEETVRKRKYRARKALLAALAVGCAALAACVVLCFGVRTANADLRRFCTVGISTLGGWTVILLTELLILPETREYRHEEGVLREKPECHEGIILHLGEEIGIPKSIAFVPVTLQEEDREVQLRLNARCRKGFPAEGTAIRAETKRKYITGFEVTENEKA